MWERFKSLPMVYKAGSLFIILMLVAMLAAWFDKTPVGNPNQFTPAPPIAGTQDIPKEDKKLPGGTIKIKPKDKVKKKVPLPPEIADNKDVEILETAEAPPSENGTHIVAIVNTLSGESHIYTKEKSAPFIAFENKRRIGVGYGVGTEGTSMKVYGEWSFLRVAGAHVGVQTEVNASNKKSPEAKATAVIDYRW